jgi:hypothetical protein
MVRRLLINGPWTLGIYMLCGLLPAFGQAGAQQKPLMAEHVFKTFKR